MWTMKIKCVPEDFYVREIMELELCDGGQFRYFLMKKKGWNTMDAIMEISKRCGVKFENFGYGGNKDKNAVTEQYFSARGVGRELEGLRIKDLDIKFVGRGMERITLGMLEGNEFRIVVRDLDKERELKIDRVKNFFDEQRFGNEGKNWQIGKAIVKREFNCACDMLGLSAEGRDYVNALRRIGRKMLRFYVHSYQSYLFNGFLRETKEDFGEEDFGEVPLVGYLTTFGNKDVKRVYSRILRDEGVELSCFLIREINEISSEGGMRRMFVGVKDFEYEWSDDELNNGKKKVELRFRLDPGAYGTLVVKSLFSNS